MTARVNPPLIRDADIVAVLARWTPEQMEAIAERLRDGGEHDQAVWVEDVVWHCRRYGNRFGFVKDGALGLSLEERTPALAREVAAELTAWADENDTVPIVLSRATADGAVRGRGWPLGGAHTADVLVVLAAALGEPAS